MVQHHRREAVLFRVGRVHVLPLRGDDRDRPPWLRRLPSTCRGLVQLYDRYNVPGPGQWHDTERRQQWGPAGLRLLQSRKRQRLVKGSPCFGGPRIGQSGDGRRSRRYSLCDPGLPPEAWGSGGLQDLVRVADHEGCLHKIERDLRLDAHANPASPASPDWCKAVCLQLRDGSYCVCRHWGGMDPRPSIIEPRPGALTSAPKPSCGHWSRRGVCDTWITARP